MVKVITIYPTGFACNSFLITKDGKNAVMIDAGQMGIMEDVMETGLRVTHVLLTHGHFDHTNGCVYMQRAGAKVGCLEKELDVIENCNLAYEFGAFTKEFKPDFFFEEGEMELNGIKINVIATPGHTEGSASFVIEDNLFTGDTLFKGNVGRTDFPSGDTQKIIASIKKLYSLEGDYKIYAGHDGETTLEWERKHNAFVRED